MSISESGSRNHMPLLSPLLLVGWLTVGLGCVSQGTFDELQERHNALEKRAAALAQEKQKLESSLGTSGNKLQEAQKNIGDLEAALAKLREQKEQSDARVASFKELLSKFQSMIDSGKLNVKLVRGRMIVELASDVLFAPGSAKLSADGQATIAQATEVLVGLQGRSFQIEGHTDNDPIKTKVFPSNWELASARALSVIRTMIDGGMPPTRVSAASFSEHMPMASNDTTEGKAQNRRIEIVLVPDLTQLPGFSEIQELVGGGAASSESSPPATESRDIPAAPPLEKEDVLNEE